MNAAMRTIFTKFDISNVTLRNRLAVAPMTRVSATEEGFVTCRIADYYKRFAKGGFGLIITEGLYTDQRYSQGYAFQPGMSSYEQAASWKPVVQTVHENGAKIFAQIMHAGALSQGNRFVKGSVGPSAVQPKGQQMTVYRGRGPYRLPAQITDKQLTEAVAGFGAAATLAIETSAFDGIEIHGANGYLLDEFLTDYTNLRDDKWGGETAQRLGLILEVVKTAKAAVGGRAPIGVRISQGKVNDFGYKWSNGERDAETIFGSLSDAGVSFIHITESIAANAAFKSCKKSLTSLARQFAPKVPIIANGSVHTEEDSNLMMEHGADIVALGRSALANPDWPNLVRDGKALREFDASILQPIAHVKDDELLLS